MSYRVTAPLVLAKQNNGLVQYVYQGGLLPEGTDEKHCVELAKLGMVVEVGAKAQVQGPDPLASPLDGPHSPLAAPVRASKPAQVAPKVAWVDYAVSQGCDRDEAEGLTKAELVDRFGG